MIDYREAREFVLSSVTALAPTTRTVEESLGGVLAESIVALEPVPGFVNSSMDGFALRSVDAAAGARLRVVGARMAGEGAPARVGPGEALRVMTGAPIPEGADCVCVIEEARVSPAGDEVEISRAIGAGEFVRQPGEDVALGQILAEPGDVLTPARVGSLASQGIAAVLVHPRPRVAVLSTGNEVTGSPGPLSPGQIRDVNRPLLRALIEESGAEPLDLGVVADEFGAIAARFREGLGACDALVSTGGVSVGDADHVKRVIAELGGSTARSMQVAIKPGKPFAFGVIGETRQPVFGLPGNPVSTRVTFEMFVRPALRKMAGHRRLDRFAVDAVLDTPLARAPDGRLYLTHVVARVQNDGRVHVERVVRSGSHLMSAVVEANALAVVPDGDSLGAGDVVRLIVLDPDRLDGPR